VRIQQMRTYSLAIINELLLVIYGVCVISCSSTIEDEDELLYGESIGTVDKQVTETHPRFIYLCQHIIFLQS